MVHSQTTNISHLQSGATYLVRVTSMAFQHLILLEQKVKRTTHYYENIPYCTSLKKHNFFPTTKFPRCGWQFSWDLPPKKACNSEIFPTTSHGPRPNPVNQSYARLDLADGIWGLNVWWNAKKYYWNLAVGKLCNCSNSLPCAIWQTTKQLQVNITPPRKYPQIHISLWQNSCAAQSP